MPHSRQCQLSRTSLALVMQVRPCRLRLGPFLLDNNRRTSRLWRKDEDISLLRHSMQAVALDYATQMFLRKRSHASLQIGFVQTTKKLDGFGRISVLLEPLLRMGLRPFHRPRLPWPRLVVCSLTRGAHLQKECPNRGSLSDLDKAASAKETRGAETAAGSFC
jgi:hypothetical protein